MIIPHIEETLVAEAVEQLKVLAAGRSEEFVDWLGPVTAPFEQPMRDEDLESAMKHFAGRSVRTCQ